MQSTQMLRRHVLSFGLSCSLALAGSAGLAYADDPCAAFTWDVHHERSLFGNQPKNLIAGQTAAASPTVIPDQLYQLELRSQSEVKFLQPPGRKPGDGAAFAGLVRLTVETAGVYRISLDQPQWIDVIANGDIVPAKDFQGRPGCNAPHKIVEFLLPARIPITLQFSGARVSTVKATVTRAPDRPS